jgi:peptidoglycan/LPS O-acetylase OafA/YrhL
MHDHPARNSNHLKWLAKLSRITTPGRTFIPQIDGLRFIAIMAVIGFHVRVICSYHLRATPAGKAIEGDVVNDIFVVGHLGVELFFAISGFILSLPFARWRLAGGKPVGLRGYYLRRITRIEPPYVIHLAFLFLFCALILRHQPMHQEYFVNSGWFRYCSRHILASLFYSNGFIYGTHPYPNVVLWSLEIEVQFYILAPLLAQVFRIGGTWQRRGLLAGGIVLAPLLATQIGDRLGHPYWAVFSLAGNLQYFLVGFLLADWQVKRSAPPSRNYWWDLSFILGCAVVVFFRHDSWMYSALPAIIGICCLAAFCGTMAFRILGHPLITTIGGMCYTIYMYHWLMISALVRLFIHVRTHILWLDLLIYFVGMSVVIIAACAVLFALFERPFMRRDWPVKLWKKIHASPRKAGVVEF